MAVNPPFNSTIAEAAPQPGTYFPAPPTLLDSPSSAVSPSGASPDAAMYTFDDGRLIPEMRNFASTADPFASIGAAVLYSFLDFVFANAPQVFPANPSGPGTPFQPTPFTFNLTTAMQSAYPGGSAPTSVNNIVGALSSADPGGNANLAASGPSDFALKAAACADLAVSGCNAQSRFLSNWSPSAGVGQLPAMIQEVVWQIAPLIQFWMTNQDVLNLPSFNLNGGDWNGLSIGLAEAAFRRVFRVLQVLLGSATHAVTNRPHLGYIAVSGEDDLPSVPVNVPRIPFPQYTTQVNTSFTTPAGQTFNNTVNTRFTIATNFPGALGEVQDANLGFEVNSSASTMIGTIGTGSLYILFIHGHMSRIEEASDLIPALFSTATGGLPITVIAMDLPGMGYATCPLDTEVDNVQGQTFAGVSDIQYPLQFPHLEFIEAFVEAFLAQLQLPRLDAIIGGSLGGHMGMRLALGGTTKTIIWSPISIEPSTQQLPLGLGSLVAWQLNGWPFGGPGPTSQPEVVAPPGTTSGDSRFNYFQSVYAQNSIPLISPPQPVQWYRRQTDFAPSNIELMRDSALDRMETYRAAFRLWHWRTAYECVLFSFLDIDPISGQPRSQQVTAPLLLCAGSRDNYCPSPNLFAWTCVFAQLVQNAGNTAIETMFPLDTGHSIHNERPMLLATAVLQFIAGGSGVVGSPWANPICQVPWNLIVGTEAMVIGAQTYTCSFNITQFVSKGTTSCLSVCKGSGFWGALWGILCMATVGIPCVIGTILVGIVISGVSVFICNISSIVGMVNGCALDACPDLNPSAPPVVF